jgi:hypothetical protein
MLGHHTALAALRAGHEVIVGGLLNRSTKAMESCHSDGLSIEGTL